MRRIGYALLIYATMILMAFVVVGCGDTYDESDTVAQQRFEKFTSQEKTIYKAVQDVWGQRRLVYIREAVGKREARPEESKIPFGDIANVIKSNNSATLKFDDSWTASTKNKYIKARWDRVDEKWYRELMLTMGVTEIIKQELIPEEVVEEDIPEPEVTQLTNDIRQINNYIDEHPEVLKVNIKDIVPESEYDNIYYEIKYCEEAILMYQSIINDRLLTLEDHELLIKLSIKCKADKIGQKLTEWNK